VRRCWLSLCTLWSSHSQGPNEQISFIMTMCLPILQLLCRLFFLAKHHITQVCQPPYSPYLALCDFWQKSPLKWGRFVNAMVTVYKLSQRCLTADWLPPRESDCSWMHIKVSSDWLPSYIKATWRFWRYSKWLDTFRIALVFVFETCVALGSGATDSSVWFVYNRGNTDDEASCYCEDMNWEMK